MHAEKPKLALTMGDPAGIGPEVIVRAWSDTRVHTCCTPIVFGHPEILKRAVQLIGATHSIQVVQDLSFEVSPDANRIACLAVGRNEALDVEPGATDARTGEAAYQAVVRAIDETQAGRIAGIVTAPLSKAALHAAEHFYPGHTELLAERCGVREFAMMLYLPPEELPHSPAGLGVVHVTLHMALREVFEHLSTEAIVEKCRLAQGVMSQGFGLAQPRIGVCALNPHAGETGLFGDEEQRVIAPAVAAAQNLGMDATGPFPTDTLMVRARAGEFDAVVAMYHDQGHIALKLLGMHRAVNITLGLPIIRTSVAHGTASDRAWRGTAEASGMVAAIMTAAKLATRHVSRHIE